MIRSGSSPLLSLYLFNGKEVEGLLEQWQKNIIESKIRYPVFSLEWLTPDERVISESIVDVISGSINFDVSSPNRRGANLVIKNLNREYIPSPTSKLWLNNKIRLKAGYNYNDSDYLWFNQGVYILGNPSVLSAPSQKEVTIQLHDKWLLLNGEHEGKLENKHVIPVGTRIDLAVKGLLELVGINKYIIDPIEYYTPYTIEKPINDSIGSILIELADLYSYEVYFDNNGYLNFRKAIQPEEIEQIPSTWTYTTSGLYLQSTREIKLDEVRNKVVVYGDYDEDTGIQYKGEAKDVTGSIFSIDKIGEKVEILELDELWSNDLCQQRADKELFDRIKVQEQVVMNIIPNYSHQLNDVVTVDDINNGTSGNYIIQSISYNIGHDSTMTLGLWKARNWS